MPQVPFSQMCLTTCLRWGTQLRMETSKTLLSTCAQECPSVADILASPTSLSLTKHPEITTLRKHLHLKLLQTASGRTETETTFQITRTKVRLMYTLVSSPVPVWKPHQCVSIVKPGFGEAVMLNDDVTSPVGLVSLSKRPQRAHVAY